MAEVETAAPPKPRRDVPPVGRFAVELGDQKNSIFFWHPNQSKYRGRFVWANVPSTQMPTEDPIARAPDLPGQVIVIDPTRRRVLVHDPMSDERNKELLAVWQHCLAASPMGGRQGPEKEMELVNLPDDTLKTWAYWARRLFDNAECTAVMGKVPEMSEVMAMPGQIYGETSDPRRPASGKTRYRQPEIAYQPPKPVLKPIGDAALLPPELE